MSTLDPAIAHDDVSMSAIHALFDTLVDYAPGATRLVPRLAARWDVSPDARHFTFTLRDGLAYSDGAPVVAADVAASLDRARTLPDSPYGGTSPTSRRSPHRRRASSSSTSRTATPRSCTRSRCRSRRRVHDGAGVGPFVLAAWDPACASSSCATIATATRRARTSTRSSCARTCRRRAVPDVRARRARRRRSPRLARLPVARGRAGVAAVPAKRADAVGVRLAHERARAAVRRRRVRQRAQLRARQGARAEAARRHRRGRARPAAARRARPRRHARAVPARPGEGARAARRGRLSQRLRRRAT